METYFAPVERMGRDAVMAAMEEASSNPVISTMLTNVAGMLAILNEQR